MRQVRPAFVALLVLLVAASLTACQRQRVPNWVEIPAGYRGYLVVQFEDASCPPLERRGDYEVIRFGDDGRACTSNRYSDQEGVAKDRWFYFYSDGHLEELTYNDVNFGTMYGGTLHRMSGSVFAPPGGNSLVNYAIGNCNWADAACWQPLRDWNH